MTKQQITAGIAGIIATGGFVTAFVLLKPTNVTLCDHDGCKNISKAYYGILKKDLATRMEADTPLTIDQWNELISVLNEEAKGGMNLRAVGDKRSMKQAIIAKLKE